MANRRSFIKKSLLSGVAFSTLPSLLAFSDNREPSSLNLSELGSIADDQDWTKIRSQFLYKGESSFLNTASLGLMPKVTIDAIYTSMIELEEKGRSGRWLFDNCRKKVAAFLNADEEEIAMTRNATESMNIMARALDLKKEDEIIISRHEHIGGAAPWIALQKELGVKVISVELDLNAENNLNILKKAISSKTKVISFSHLLCTTGMIMPAKEIVELCRNNKIYSCIDGAQALGQIPIDLKEIKPDFYAASGHKWLFGPKGSGILFINKGVVEECKPPFAGAYTDSKFNLADSVLEYRNVAAREEYGTRNASHVKGIETAVDFIQAIGIEKVANRGKELSKNIRNQISLLPHVEILSPENPDYSASILTFRFKQRDNKEIVKELRTQHQLVIRHIYENDLDAIRISSAIYNQEEELDQLFSALSLYK